MVSRVTRRWPRKTIAVMALIGAVALLVLYSRATVGTAAGPKCTVPQATCDAVKNKTEDLHNRVVSRRIEKEDEEDERATNPVPSLSPEQAMTLARQALASVGVAPETVQ